MTYQIPVLLLILLTLALATGCVQNFHEPAPAMTTAETPVPIPTSVPVEPVSQVTNALLPQEMTLPTPELTLIVPTLLPISEPTVMAQQNSTHDPVVEFRDRTLLVLDNLQESKDGVLRMYKSGDIANVKAKATDYALFIRRNNAVTNMPRKMDYVRLNYYEYTDQAGQFAQCFTDGADRWMANDKSSANSFFDAGIMASERADIADKRIRVFLKDHV
jgi:hypothetical protein